MTKLYPWVWIGWGVLFFILEFIPLAMGKPQYTLSEYIWRLENYHPFWNAVRYLIAAICLWLSLHLVFRWFP